MDYIVQHHHDKVMNKSINQFDINLFKLRDISKWSIPSHSDVAKITWHI